MRLCFLLVRRVPPVPSPVLVEAWALLRERGFAIDTVIAEEVVQRPEDLEPKHDLYVLKSHTELSLSLAGVLHDRGARVLNPYPNCQLTQNKITAFARLRAADVPVPDAWVTGELARLADLADTRPLVIKPYRGHRGVGVRVVRSAEELLALPEPTEPVIVQRFIPGPGEDLKLYVVGDHVFAVRKPFSPTSFTIPGRPAEVDERLRELGLRAGRALGLGLFGLDVIESPDGPVVVDANYFPGYKGVPEVAPLIARHIEAYARGEVELELPALTAS